MKSNQEGYRLAAEHHNFVAKNCATYVESNGKDGPALSVIVGAVVPGLYEHWKSQHGDPKFYIVHGSGVEQDTHRPFATYRSLYGDHAGELTARHLVDDTIGFLAPINREVYTGPRFVMVSPLRLGQMETVLLGLDGLLLFKTPAGVVEHISELLKMPIHQI